MITTPWTKARRSGTNGGGCVEIRHHAGMVEVRDSKQRGNGPILTFTLLEFDAFLDGARNGEFNAFLDSGSGNEPAPHHAHSAEPPKG